MCFIISFIILANIVVCDYFCSFIFFFAFVSPAQTIKFNLLIAFMTSHCNKVYHNAFFFLLFYCFFEVLLKVMCLLYFIIFIFNIFVCNTSCCRCKIYYTCFFSSSWNYVFLLLWFHRPFQWKTSFIIKFFGINLL